MLLPLPVMLQLGWQLHPDYYCQPSLALVHARLEESGFDYFPL